MLSHVAELLDERSWDIETSWEDASPSPTTELNGRAYSYGIPFIPTLRAQRGDVVLRISALGPTLGIVGMNGREMLIPGYKGLKGIPLKMCQKAWRI